MNTTQVNALAPVQAAEQDLRDESPLLVEQLSIDELAVREEFAACATITK
jgi:hypothetical protein